MGYAISLKVRTYGKALNVDTNKNISPLNGWYFDTLIWMETFVLGVNYVSTPIHVFARWLAIDFPSVW